jgi:hypothetical protein
MPPSSRGPRLKSSAQQPTLLTPLKLLFSSKRLKSYEAFRRSQPPYVPFLREHCDQIILRVGIKVTGWARRNPAVTAGAVVGTAGATCLAAPIVAAVPLLSVSGFSAAGVGSGECCCIRYFSGHFSHHLNTNYAIKMLI